MAAGFYDPQSAAGTLIDRERGPDRLNPGEMPAYPVGYRSFFG
jgi:hypothetical protein